jgi:hypothetical protein
VLALERVEGQPDGREGEDEEAEVVDLYPAEDVTEPAQGDDEDRLHEQVPHDHPQQVRHVAGGERVQLDAAEDGRQRDDDDRPVDGRHEHRERRVRQGDPLVGVALAGGPASALPVASALVAGPVFARPGSHVY